MSKSLFHESLSHPEPPAHFSVLLNSLWYDKKGDWKKAHDLVDSLPGAEAAWVHAYLHRKEGDLWNADYWYRRAGETRPSVTLDQEWEELVKRYLV